MSFNSLYIQQEDWGLTLKAASTPGKAGTLTVLSLFDVGNVGGVVFITSM
jgi:hypothetical protein